MLDRLSVDEYLQQRARLFLTHDGKGGFGIIGTEVVSLFSYPEARHGTALMTRALEEGASFLSCFDVNGYLPRFYERFGFQEVARYSFDRDLAPSNWLYDELGTPDVIQMSRV
jgi:predicted GNAT family N-acyltransferase